MSTMQNKELVRNFFEEVFNKRNIDAVDQFLSPTFVAHGPASLGAEEMLQGPAGMKRGAQMFHEAFPDFHVALESLISEGDTVAARGTYSGTQKGSFMGIPPTNKRLSWQTMIFGRIADGKIAEAWVSGDQLGMLQQAGVIPERLEMPVAR